MFQAAIDDFREFFRGKASKSHNAPEIRFQCWTLSEAAGARFVCERQHALGDGSGSSKPLQCSEDADFLIALRFIGNH